MEAAEKEGLISIESAVMDAARSLRVDPWPLTRSKARRRPTLRDAAVVIYTTIVLLFLANPRSVADRLADFPQSAITEAVTNFIGDLSSRVGFQEAYDSARNAFLDALAEQHRRGRR